VFNLYLMIPMGIIVSYLNKHGFPVAPLVIGVILGSMSDSNLRRGLMVSQGSLKPFVTRPVALLLVIVHRHDVSLRNKVLAECHEKTETEESNALRK